MGPSVAVSFTPVTVTVCGTFQFPGVNIRLAGETVPSPVFELARGIVTFPEGSVFSWTVKVAVVPFSLVWPETSVTENPAESPSAMLTVAADGLITVYVGAAGVSVTTTVTVGSATKSSITVTGITAVDCPAGIVTDPGSAWYCTPGVAVPPTV